MGCFSYDKPAANVNSVAHAVKVLQAFRLRTLGKQLGRDPPASPLRHFGTVLAVQKSDEKN